MASEPSARYGTPMPDRYAEEANPTWDPEREKRRLQVYTRLYVIALFLIAVLIITAQAILSDSIRDNDEFAEQMGTLRKFHSRIQRVYHSVEVLGHLPPAQAVERHLYLLEGLLSDLRGNLDNFEITTGPVRRHIGTEPEGNQFLDEILMLSGQVHHQSQGLVARFRATPFDPEAIRLDAESILQLAPRLNAITETAGNFLIQRVEVRRVHFWLQEVVITSFIIILLFAEAFLIFRPAGRRILSITDRLIDAHRHNQMISRRLQALAGELSTRNGELEASLHQIHTMHHALLAQSGPAAFGTVARGIAGQLEHPIRDLRNNLQTSLELSSDLERALRLGGSRIPVRIRDELQTVSSEMAMRLSGQMVRIESMEQLITVARSFQPDRLSDKDVTGTRPSIAGRRSILELSALFEEAVAVYRAAGAELDPPLEPGAPGSSVHLPPVELVVDAEDNQNAYVPRQLFITSLVELMTNAARATRIRQVYGPAPEGYHRLIGLSVNADPKCPGGIVVRVMDNGVGMGPEIRQRALEPFFSTKPGGLGMGLTHVHDFIVYGLGGTVHIGDTPGGGATVRLHIPPKDMGMMTPLPD